MNNLEERKEQAQQEFSALLDWVVEETEKIRQRLDAEGAPHGLDTNREAYAPVNKEYERRFKELLEKYKDLPPDTKIILVGSKHLD